MESKNKIFTETIGTSSIAKTMRNSLVPTESTKRNIEKERNYNWWSVTSREKTTIKRNYGWILQNVYR